MSRPPSQIRYGNRIISQKQDLQSLQKHYQSLKRTRPMTGNIQNRQTITINNKKKQMVQQNRFTEIQRQNRMLFQKITTIMNKGTLSQTIYPADCSKKKLNRTLNGVYRKKQLQNIEYENAKMLKRLKQKTSTYKVNNFHRDWQKKKAVIKNMSLYPFILNDNIGASINRQRIQNSFLIRKNTHNQLNLPQNSWEMRRVRNINGHMFLITIKSQQDKFFIIGDIKQQQNIKIIQLTRQEGQQFIKDECYGNLQKIFDLLRYDQQSGDLYLVGRDFNENDQAQMFELERKRAQSNQGNRVNLRNTKLSNYNKQRNSSMSNSNSNIPPKLLSKQLAKRNKYKLIDNQEEETNYRNQQSLPKRINLSVEKPRQKVKINKINFQVQNQFLSQQPNNLIPKDLNQQDQRPNFIKEKQQIKIQINRKKQENRVKQRQQEKDKKKRISEWVKVENKQDQQIQQHQIQNHQNRNLNLQQDHNFQENFVQNPLQA